MFSMFRGTPVLLLKDTGPQCSFVAPTRFAWRLVPVCEANRGKSHVRATGLQSVAILPGEPMAIRLAKRTATNAVSWSEL